MHNPREPHLVAAHKILWYLKGTLGHEILLRRDIKIIGSGYADASWAGDPSDEDLGHDTIAFLETI